MSDGPVSGLPAAPSFLATLQFLVNNGGVSQSVLASLMQAAWGDDFLGSTFLAAAGHETDVVTLTWPPGSGIPATRKRLWIDVIIPSYGGSPDPTGDIGSLRFNGDAGANYWSRHLEYFSGVWNDFQSTGASLIRMAAENSRLSRNVSVSVNNIANRTKSCSIKNQTATNDPLVAGSVNIAGGEWVNLVDQIATVQLVNAGANNMGTGTGFIVRGRDL